MTQKVLVVDDVSMFVELEKDFLQLSAVKVLTARDGEQALKICREEHPNLVFMDLHMPVMNGADSCVAIKKDPTLHSTAVVLIASEGKEADRRLSMKAGCDDFLTKPLDRHLFLEAARKLLPTINRRDRRVPCRFNVKYRAFGVTLSGFAVDLSQHGLYLATDFGLQQGTELDLIFALPEPYGTIVQTKARVTWLNSKDTRLKLSLPFGFGVEFLSLGDEAEKNILSFVENQPNAI
jgi:two-component system, OmpR family, alkaline phosphatase synthesis response regulator PhoP